MQNLGWLAVEVRKFASNLIVLIRHRFETANTNVFGYYVYYGLKEKKLKFPREAFSEETWSSVSRAELVISLDLHKH